INSAYNPTVTFTGGGGATPYTFAVVVGTLPAGLMLDSNSGLLSGTPTVSGKLSITVQATDKNNCSGHQVYTLISCRFCDDFEDGNFTSPAWTVKSGTWSVVLDGTRYLDGLTSSTVTGTIIPPTFTAPAIRTVEFDRVKFLTANSRVVFTAW